MNEFEYPMCEDCGVEMYNRFTDPMTDIDGFGCPECGWTIDEEPFVMEDNRSLDEIFGDTYLYTKKFADDLMVFWKDKGQGYTRDIDLAGVWPLSEALKIAKSAGDHVVPILKSDLKAKLKIQRVVNKEHSDNHDSVRHLEKLVSVYSKQYDDLDKKEQ